MSPNRTFSWFLLLTATLAPIVLSAQPTRAEAAKNVCAKGNATPMNCGGAVLRELEALQDQPKAALELGLLWGTVYAKEVDRMEKTGRLKKAEKDFDKIEAWFAEKVDPISLGADAALDATLKKYLPKVATVLGLLEAPLAGLRAFFDSSQIGTDFDELSALNDQIQELIARQLDAHLKSGWRSDLEAIARSAGPALRRNP